MPCGLINLSIRFGFRSCDIHASATACIVQAVNVNMGVSAQGNPMPTGTVANAGNPHGNPDHAPAQSPTLVTGLPIVPGATLTFDQITGLSTNDPNNLQVTPDGDPTFVVSNYAGSEHGISNMQAPINSLVGVFLDDNQPDLTTSPTPLDFSSSASRDFTSESPKLKQVFYIGDGVTSTSVTQQFVVPTGATRFYLATMDGYEWNNNLGSRTVRINRPAVVSLVK